MNDIYGCGCSGSDDDWEEEVERILREIEEGEAPIPVEDWPTKPERIPVEDWPVRKEEEVEVEAE